MFLQSLKDKPLSLLIAPFATLGWVLFLFSFPTPCLLQAAEPNLDSSTLAKEVATKGWLLYSAKTPEGSYDLFLARPDGTQVRNLTHSPEYTEFGGKFSPDGKQMLYRRVPKGEEINHDLWGAAGTLMLANADGSNPVAVGEEGDFPWACWGKDSQQIACLYKRQGKIRLIDLKTKATLQEFSRQGIFQQMYWSPDGLHLCGTANLEGQDWNVVSLEVKTGQTTLLSRNLNCTPDWFQKDSHRVIYSNRTPGLANDYGWTMLMQASDDGKDRTLIYGEKGRHIYYGCTSPDDQYVVFSRPEQDGGVDAPMAVMRLADAPIVAPDYPELKALYPNAHAGPVLQINLNGFEPQWTYLEIDPK